MKSIKLLGVFVLMMAFTLHTIAQNSIDRYFDQYKNDDRFSRISVSSRMFDLFVDIEMDDPAEQELIETISKLDGLKALIGNEIDEAPNLYQDILDRPAAGMDELMSFSETDTEFRFFIRESNGKISELLMVGYDQSQIMIMSLTGDIDLRQIAQLSQKMNIEGFEHFKNIH